MKPFVFSGLPSRVVFGAGSIRALGEEIGKLGATRVLMMSTQGRAGMVRGLANGLPVAGFFEDAVMHTPIDAVNHAREVADSVKADCCVTVGGGSTIGFAKAIARTTGIPIIAVPTTYSGSEMTTIWGTSEGGLKKTGRDPKVLPKTVIYDPQLTLDLPPKVSAASGMNAIAHCVEALYAHDGNPIVSIMAEEGIRALAHSLPTIVRSPQDADARSEALYGAWLCGIVLGSAGMALHHKLCHVLGGSFNLPHAETHSIVLPHAMRYNQSATEAMQRIARAIGAADAASGIYDLEKKLGLPLRLADIGMKEADLERAARLATEAPYPNPRKVEYAPVLELLRDAYQGRRPS